MQGRIINSGKLYNKGLNKIELTVDKGIYIVKVISGNKSFSKQVPLVE